MRRILEICISDFTSACNAANGGADRVELCADIASGGITPSAGLIRKVCANVEIPVQVLIRPRPGDFVISLDEYDIMRHDIDVARQAGVAGIVIGALREDNKVDQEMTARLCAHAKPLNVTFHRALDLTPCPVEAFRDLIALGIDRVLTSGGPGAARQHLEALREIKQLAPDSVAVMAGGSITLEDLADLIRVCDLREFHVGSWVTRPTQATSPFGSPPAQVHPGRVSQIVRAITSAG